MNEKESHITRIGGSIFVKLPHEIITDSQFPNSKVVKLKRREKIPVIIKLEGNRLLITEKDMVTEVKK